MNSPCEKSSYYGYITWFNSLITKIQVTHDNKLFFVKKISSILKNCHYHYTNVIHSFMGVGILPNPTICMYPE